MNGAFQVGRALVIHEFSERIRDRWVMVISVLFALMAGGVSMYGRSAEESSAVLTGPSLVTLAGLLVPLVALILGHDAICGERERNTLGLLLSLPARSSELLFAKFGGRMLALFTSVAVGLGTALVFSDPGGRRALVVLFVPTLLLGATFLAMGICMSAIATRQATSASMAVTTWFLLVFFYDMGLLAVLFITDGAVGAGTVAKAVIANPAGLYRVSMLDSFGGLASSDALQVGLTTPGAGAQMVLWSAWILGLLIVASLALHLRKAHR